MALTVPVEGVDGVVAAFAKNDIAISHMAKRLSYEEPGYAAGMHPGDDYFTSPFAIVSGWTRKRPGQPKKKVALLCFTAFKCRGAHDEAIAAMGELGRGMVAFRSMRSVEESLCKPVHVAKFRRYAWAGGDDVSLDLEDRAMKMACASLGADVPSDWRARRDEIVKQHAVWPLRQLPQTAELAPDADVPKPAPLERCACGNFARPGGPLCNACTTAASTGV